MMRMVGVSEEREESKMTSWVIVMGNTADHRLGVGRRGRGVFGTEFEMPGNL